MARLTLGQKAERMLKFLLGVRNARAAAVLKGYGFSEKDLNEGWALLRALGKSRLDAEETPGAYDPALVQQLDAWENKWFPIADATLRRHAPTVHASFFRNLSQTEGAAVIVGVGTFIERFHSLDKAEDKGGPKGGGGKAAKKKLQERGLTDAVIQEAQALLKELGSLSDPVPDVATSDDQEAQLAKAEDEMWAWYLEWSQIARTKIKQRALLRSMGFLRTNKAGVEEEIPEDEFEPDDKDEEDGEPEPEKGKAEPEKGKAEPEKKEEPGKPA
ncbi:MAG: hypothetical protein IPK82_27905 [Polyangiaceae bacterium]|nr:hypothetical protein [Polyangiaceae bacterium]